MKDVISKILDSVRESLNENECWECNLSLDRCGYSRFYFNNNRVRAHRIVWEAYNAEPIPQDKIILHSCDNPSCVNPNHLRLGSWKENMQDRSDRYRNWGGKHGQKLTKEQIQFINNSSLRNFELAKLFNVTPPSIRYHRQKNQGTKNGKQSKS